MSSTPTAEDTQLSGLGLSSPLVTFSNVHSGIRTPTSKRMAPVSAGSDHPLAGPTNHPPASVELSPQVTPSPTPEPALASPPPPVTRTTPPPKPAPPTVVKLPPVKKAPATSLDDMADEFLSQASPRTEAGLPPLLKPVPLPRGESGIARLRTLAVRRAWGDVMQVCGDMLRGPTSPHTPLYASLVNHDVALDKEEQVPPPPQGALREETIEILTLECHAWLLLRRYGELGREIDRWNFLSRNDSSATSPSWVPWSLHILAAESLQYTDPSSNRCTDELYSLREVLTEKKQTAWLPCVDNALANAFIRSNEWRLALHALDNILEFLPVATRAFYPEENTDALSGAFKCEVLSRQGRIMLQIGALLEASTLFEAVKKEWDTICTFHSSHSMFQTVPIQIRINDGLACFALAQYDQAMTHYRKAIDLERSKATTCGEESGKTGPLLLRQDAHQLSQCWNNMALCALYTCRLQDAVRMMETVVREDPTQFLTERLAFNLCTLYELGSDAATGTRKKRVLQVISKRFYLHDIGPESFRVSP